MIPGGASALHSFTMSKKGEMSLLNNWVVISFAAVMSDVKKDVALIPIFTRFWKRWLWRQSYYCDHSYQLQLSRICLTTIWKIRVQCNFQVLFFNQPWYILNLFSYILWYYLSFPGQPSFILLCSIQWVGGHSEDTIHIKDVLSVESSPN